MLLFRSLCTYVTLGTYWSLYLYMCHLIAAPTDLKQEEQQERAACLRFLLYAAFIFLIPSSLALVLSDLYCLLLCVRRCCLCSKGAQSAQLLEDLEANTNRLVSAQLLPQYSNPKRSL